MHVYLLDLVFVLAVAGVAWAVARRPLVHAAAIWFTFVLAALIALNCFEPVATFINENMFAKTDVVVTRFLWFFALIAIFVGVTTLSLMAVFKVLPDATDLVGGGDGLGSRAGVRWCFSLLAGYTLAAFLLTSLHTLPSNRDFWGAFPPEVGKRSGPIMAFAPDYQFLTLAEYTCVPRAALTGSPWKPDGPLNGVNMQANRWASFPNRYAIWREGVSIMVYGEDFPFGPDDEDWAADDEDWGADDEDWGAD